MNLPHLLAPWALLGLGVLLPALLRRFDVGRLVAKTLEEAHIPRKVAADVMGIKESQLSRMVNGTGQEHLSLDRLSRLPTDPFWVLFPLAVWEELGVIPRAEDRATRLARVTARSLRAQLRREDKEEDRPDVCVA